MIDDITWNDLGMDEVFKCINNTNSSVGQEYLYKMLREPVADAEKLHELDRLADEFTANEKAVYNLVTLKIICIFVRIQKNSVWNNYIIICRASWLPLFW